jgi:hypothetical protein
MYSTFKIVSDISKVQLKEFSVDSTSADDITAGTICDFSDEDTIGVESTASNYASKPLFLCIQGPSYSKDSIGQANVVFAGTIEIQTSNITLTSGAVNTKVYAGTKGKLQDTDPGSGVAVGYITKIVDATTAIVRITLN